MRRHFSPTSRRGANFGRPGPPVPRRCFWLLAAAFLFYMVVAWLATSGPSKIGKPGKHRPPLIVQAEPPADEGTLFPERSIHVVLQCSSHMHVDTEPPYQLLQLLLTRSSAVASVALMTTMNASSPTSPFAEEYLQRMFGTRRVRVISSHADPAVSFSVLLNRGADARPVKGMKDGETGGPDSDAALSGLTREGDESGGDGGGEKASTERLSRNVAPYVLFLSSRLRVEMPLKNWLDAFYSAFERGGALAKRAGDEPSLRRPARSPKSAGGGQVGIVGCTIVSGPPVSAGGSSERVVLSSGLDAATGALGDVFLVHHASGASVLSRNVRDVHEALAPPSSCFMISSSAWNALHGVRETKEGDWRSVVANFLWEGSVYKTLALHGYNALVQCDPLVRQLPYSRLDATLFDQFRSHIASAFAEIQALSLWMGGLNVGELPVGLAGMSQKCHDRRAVALFRGGGFLYVSQALRREFGLPVEESRNGTVPGAGSAAQDLPEKLRSGILQKQDEIRRRRVMLGPRGAAEPEILGDGPLEDQPAFRQFLQSLQQVQKMIAQSQAAEKELKQRRAASGGDQSSGGSSRKTEAATSQHRQQNDAATVDVLSEEQFQKQMAVVTAKRMQALGMVLLESEKYLVGLVAAQARTTARFHELLSVCGSVDEPVWDLALRARRDAELRTVVVPSRVFPTSASAADYTSNFSVSRPLGGSPYLQPWATPLRQTLSAQLVPSDNFFVTWAGYCCQCCGFSNEIAAIIDPLSSMVHVRSSMPLSCHCGGLPLRVKDNLVRMFIHRGASEPSSSAANVPGSADRRRNGPVGADTDLPVDAPIHVWVYHVDPGAAVALTWKEVQVDYIVSRSMFEFTRISPVWVDLLTNSSSAGMTYNEVWVPCRFVRESYIASGVPASMLVIIPEPVDSELYDPDTVERFDLPVAVSPHPAWRAGGNALLMPLAETTAVEGKANVVAGATAEDLPQNEEYRRQVTATATALSKNYRFLSIFKWEPRKGWDVLLGAYFRAFRRSDPVSLYIQSYVWVYSDTFKGDARDPKWILADIGRVAIEVARERGATEFPPEVWAAEAEAVERHNRTVGSVILQHMPHVEVITEMLTEYEEVRLYRSCDAFVLPSRGEGWGLPIIQAMSMGMPTIATNFSGMADFITKDTVYALDVERLEDVAKDSPYGYLPHMQWAVPSLSHLVDLMRQVYAERDGAAKARGALARTHVETHFSTTAVARRVAARLAEIETLVRRRRSRTDRRRDAV